MLDEVLYWSECYAGQSVMLDRVLCLTKCYTGQSVMLDEASNYHNRAGPHNVPTHKQKPDRDERRMGIRQAGIFSSGHS